MANLMVTGGAGYVGSHVAEMLVRGGHRVWVYDNLVTGFRDFVPQQAQFIDGDIKDGDKLASVLRESKIEGVLHLAGFNTARDQKPSPLAVMEGNVAGTVSLLKAMAAASVKKLVFASSKAVYGREGKLSEEGPTSPLEPYGESKLFSEHLLEDFANSDPDFRYVSLRHFDVGGAHPEGRFGQRSKNSSSLIKTLAEVACGRRPQLEVFGQDYATADGTCVRDFVHVMDLAEAYGLAFKRLANGGGSATYNVGYGRGHTVLEAIAAMKEASGREIKFVMGERREGDFATVVAENEKIVRELGFDPQFNDLVYICATTFEFERRKA